ncbi:hypothetical protein PZB74_05800 [Porifericola rhodea]|uniref:hypothetical protein n=1 Tax=Porifericola rhodea TaxID=930972 RepID=UPI002664E7CA|nr:hypothetical protein [Porifericola rhodea]WKN32857.1 hypothetical protein PZB74_05800 [Porifericola rhodea]
MKKLVLLTLFFTALHLSVAQAQYLFTAQVDAYKTDNRNPFEFVDKAQLGLEFNYFLYDQLAVTTGVEVWTESIRFVPGMRFYPIDPVFLRFRPLLGKNVDYAFGVGYARKITDNWRLEAMTDYYFEWSNLAVRFGVGYSLY